jgi:hypothetical protein
MKRLPPINTDAHARKWAERLSARVQKVLAAHPEADPDNVRHTLILLEMPPMERLRRSLIRGRATAIFRCSAADSMNRRNSPSSIPGEWFAELPSH